MQKTNNNFSSKNQKINYLSKDFDQYKTNLIEFAKTYFPDTFKDFNDASPGMLFINLASYVGDVLSYYTDAQFKEGLMPFSEERQNILALSKYLGYKPRAVSPSEVKVDVFQLIPAIVVDGVAQPDYKYALTILSDLSVSTPDGQAFTIGESIDFESSTEDSPREVKAFSRDDAGQVQTFLLKKTVNARSGKIVTVDVSVGEAEQFYRVNLKEDNVLEILDVVDADNNKWYEVDYLSQDLVFTDVENINRNDGKLFKYKDSVPSLIGSLRTPRKFITGIYPNNTSYLEFGSGFNSNNTDEVVLNIKNVQTKSTNEILPVDPSTFVNSTNYGLAPANTVLTVRYLVGGGIESNVTADSITNISNISYAQNLEDLDDDEKQLFLSLRESVRVGNPESATGGKGTETNDEIKENALSNFNAQNRVVTKNDYMARILSMPSKYGSIAKVHVATDNEISQLAVNADANLDKSFDVNVYAMGYNHRKNLVKMNEALKNNIKQYLGRFRMLTDEINLLDGFVVNIGVNFEITTFKGENKREVLARCLTAAKEFFNIDNMNFNQSINLSRFELALANIEGVQSVQNVKIKNLTALDGDYSSVEYNIDNATIDKVVYPSLDPSVFEVKNPNKDIIGKCL